MKNIEIKYDLEQVVYYLTNDYIRTGLEVKAVKIKKIVLQKCEGQTWASYEIVALEDEYKYNAPRRYADERELFANKQELKQALNKIADSLLKTKLLTEKGLPEID